MDGIASAARFRLYIEHGIKRCLQSFMYINSLILSRRCNNIRKKTAVEGRPTCFDLQSIPFSPICSCSLGSMCFSSKSLGQSKIIGTALPWRKIFGSNPNRCGCKAALGTHCSAQLSRLCQLETVSYFEFTASASSNA